MEAQVQNHTFRITNGKQGITLNGNVYPLDYSIADDKFYRIRLHGKEFKIFVQKLDTDTKEATLNINGKISTVKLRSKADNMMNAAGVKMKVQRKLESLRSPMPGLVLSLKVKPGDTVKAGDHLLILEAMKMENVIKSPGEGKIKEIHIAERTSVEKNTLMITFE